MRGGGTGVASEGMRRVVLFAVLAAGCGGSSPVRPSATPAPTPPPAPAPVVRDGATDHTVAAELSPSTPTIGAVTTVRAPGFLVREARFDGAPFYLWPQDEAYVRAL